MLQGSIMVLTCREYHLEKKRFFFNYLRPLRREFAEIFRNSGVSILFLGEEFDFVARSASIPRLGPETSLEKRKNRADEE